MSDPARPIIFLDMDGVIADFVGASLRAVGRDPGELVEDYSIAKHVGMSESAFWAAQDADPDFWRNIEPYEHCSLLVHVLRSVGEVYICTAPSRHPNCASHKLAWCRTHLGEWTEGRVIIAKAKHLLAGPGRILVDDYDANVAAFRAAGGLAVTFPQPWNAAKGRRFTEVFAEWVQAVKAVAEPLPVENRRSREGGAA